MNYNNNHKFNERSPNGPSGFLISEKNNCQTNVLSVKETNLHMSSLFLNVALVWITYWFFYNIKFVHTYVRYSHSPCSCTNPHNTFDWQYKIILGTFILKHDWLIFPMLYWQWKNLSFDPATFENESISIRRIQDDVKVLLHLCLFLSFIVKSLNCVYFHLIFFFDLKYICVV